MSYEYCIHMYFKGGGLSPREHNIVDWLGTGCIFNL